MSQNNNTEQSIPNQQLSTEGQLILNYLRQRQADKQQQQSQNLNEQEVGEGEAIEHPSMSNNIFQNKQQQENAILSKVAGHGSITNPADNSGFNKAKNEEQDNHERDHSGFPLESNNPICQQDADNIFNQSQNEQYQLGIQETLCSESDKLVPLKKSKYRARLVGHESRGSNNDLENQQIRQQQGMKLRGEHEGLHSNKVNHGNIFSHEDDGDDVDDDDADKAPMDIHTYNKQKQNQIELQQKSKKSDLQEDQNPLGFSNGANSQLRNQQKHLLLIQQHQNQRKQSKKKKVMNSQWQLMVEEKDGEDKGSQGIEGLSNQENQVLQNIEGQQQQLEQQQIVQAGNEQVNSYQNNNNNNTNIPPNTNDDGNAAMMTEEGPIGSDVPVTNHPQNLNNNPQPQIQMPYNQFYTQSQLSQGQQQQMQLRNQLLQQNGQRLMQMIQRAQAMNLADQPQNNPSPFHFLQQISQNQQFMAQLLVAGNQQEPNTQQQLLYPFPNNNNPQNINNNNPLQTFNQSIINMNQQLPRTPPNQRVQQNSYQQPGQQQQQQQQQPQQGNFVQQPSIEGAQDNVLRNQQLRQLPNGPAFNMPISYQDFCTLQQQYTQNSQVPQQQRNPFAQGRQQPISQNLSSYNLSSQNLIPQNGSLEQPEDGDMQQSNFAGPQTLRSLIHVAVFPGSFDQSTLLSMQVQQPRQRPGANQLPQDMRNKYYIRQKHEFQESHDPDQPYMKITVMKTNQDNINNNNVHIITGKGMVNSKKNTISEDIIIGRQEMTTILDSQAQQYIEIWPTDIVLPQIDRAISRIHCKLIYKDGFRIRKKVQNEFLLFLYAVKVNKLIIPDVVLRTIWSMVRPKCAFYIVDLGSAQGTFIKIRYEKSQIIEKGQVFLIGAETQFQILDVVHSHPCVSSEQGSVENKIIPEDQDFLEFLMREKRMNTQIHGLSDEEQQKLEVLSNLPESDGQNNVTQLIDNRKSFRPYVKLKVSSSSVSFHLFLWNQVAVDQGFKIGRSQECTIQISINTISRKQSRIFYGNGKWQLKDGDLVRESANGTWISLNDYRERNESRNESDPKEIEDGTEIKISDSILKIEIFNNQPRRERPKYSISLDQMEIEQGNNQEQQEQNNKNVDQEEDQSSNNQQEIQDLDVTS